MKKDITVILPVHEISTTFETYFKRATQSLEHQVTPIEELLILHSNTKEVIDWFSNWTNDKLNFRLIKNEGKHDFCSQVNLGVEESKIQSDSKFIDDLGADSLDTVELVMAFEEEFGCEIPDDAAEKIVTLKDAVTYLTANSN